MKKQPYAPSQRLSRGEALLSLGYPELAIGDAHKALLLVQSGLDYSSELGAVVRAPILKVWYDENKSVSSTRLP